MPKRRLTALAVDLTAAGAAPEPPSLTARDAGLAATIGFAVLLVYFPALLGGFVWDDDHHVTQAALQSWEGLSRIWFKLGATEQYYPLLHTAFWLEHRLWGDAPLGYHVVNLALHTANACLLALILRRLAVPGAWLAAALFAVHPVFVESVAWITEQKNTLSTCFYLGAALVYLRFDCERRPALYASALTLFVLALLSKTFTVTLPAAILVIFWWQRGHLTWRRDLRPLVPWFALSALAGLPTAAVEQHDIGGLGSHFDFTASERLLLAGRDVVFYLGKPIWPSQLTFMYPRWRIDPESVGQWLPLFGVLGATVLLWTYRERSRGPLAVLLFFVGSLFPVLGFFNVFVFIYSFVADHFVYVPALGILAVVAAALTRALGRAGGGRWMGEVGLAVVLAGLGMLTWRQCLDYRDYSTLLRATIERNPDCWMAHNNLGSALLREGNLQEAAYHFQEAVRLSPDNPLFRSNLGGALLRLGQLPEAIAECQEAVRLWPNLANAHFNLGLAFSQTGRASEAIREFTRVLAIDPSITQARTALAQLQAAPPSP